MGAAITALCDLLFARYAFTAVFLDCYDDNVHALEFYRRSGFTVCGETPLVQRHVGDELKWLPAGLGETATRKYLIMVKRRE